MAARKPRLEKLTISLLKEGLSRAAALRDRDALAGHRVGEIDTDEESLFTASTDPHPPRWSRYLEAHVTGGLGGLLSASASAALLIEAAGRLFAVTFGQGRHLLDSEAYEQDFGLRVVLNTVAQ